MKNLTKINENGLHCAYLDGYDGLPSIITKGNPYYSLVEKLRKYEELEEQGLLHVAPVQDGTIIYGIASDGDESYVLSESYLFGVTEFSFGTYGKDFFLAEAEAEKKLKK